MSCGSRKLLVCGSRTIRDTTYIKGPTQWAKDQIEAYWYWNLAGYEDLTMIEGAAKGIDTIAKEYAQENDWKIEEYPAEWSKDKLDSWRHVFSKENAYVNIENFNKKIRAAEKRGLKVFVI